MTRIGSVIELPAENIEEYTRLHAEVWPSVLAQIARSNIRNYSIFRFGELLFSYYEYIGDDFEADMAAMAADPETQRWWTFTDPLQRGVPGRPHGEWWMTLPEVFHVD